MAEQQADQSEKTEQATPHKLREARKQGNVAKSLEVNSALAIAAGLLILLAFGQQFVHSVLGLSERLLTSAGAIDFQISSLMTHTNEWFGEGIFILSPVVALLLLTGVLATLIQIGPVFSVTPLKPDMNRLNPVNGFKQKFSTRMLFELIKSLLKLVLFSLIIYVTIHGVLEQLFRLSAFHPRAYVHEFIGYSSSLLLRLVVALIVIAVLDYLFVRWDYLRKLRMTRRELKDEIKRREGDPTIRSKRRELEKELRKRSESLSNIPDADLLITNPTRFAIALEYKRGKMVAPMITGMGSGAMAKAMRDKAHRYGIPIIRTPRLTRRLFKIGNMGQVVPQECYVAVAKALRQAYQQKRHKALYV